MTAGYDLEPVAFGYVIGTEKLIDLPSEVPAVIWRGLFSKVEDSLGGRGGL